MDKKTVKGLLVIVGIVIVSLIFFIAESARKDEITPYFVAYPEASFNVADFPPVITAISVYNGFAGELVIIEASATDPNGQSVTITFGSPLDGSGRWQSGVGDNGTHYANITASDGTTNSTHTVTIILNNSVCGDDICTGIEDCDSCPQDCGPCPEELVPSPGGGGGGGITRNIYFINLTEEGETVFLRIRDWVRYDFKEKTYTTSIDSFEGESVELRIMTRGITLLGKIKRYEEEYADLDNDGVKDISVRYNGLKSGTISLTIKLLRKDITEKKIVDEEGEEIIEEEEVGVGFRLVKAEIYEKPVSVKKDYTLLILLVVFVCVVLLVLTFTRRREVYGTMTTRLKETSRFYRAEKEKGMKRLKKLRDEGMEQLKKLKKREKGKIVATLFREKEKEKLKKMRALEKERLKKVREKEKERLKKLREREEKRREEKDEGVGKRTKEAKKMYVIEIEKDIEKKEKEKAKKIKEEEREKLARLKEKEKERMARLKEKEELKRKIEEEKKKKEDAKIKIEHEKLKIEFEKRRLKEFERKKRLEEKRKIMETRMMEEMEKKKREELEEEVRKTEETRMGYKLKKEREKYDAQKRFEEEKLKKSRQREKEKLRKLKEKEKERMINLRKEEKIMKKKEAEKREREAEKNRLENEKIKLRFERKRMIEVEEGKIKEEKKAVREKIFMRKTKKKSKEIKGRLLEGRDVYKFEKGEPLLEKVKGLFKREDIKEEEIKPMKIKKKPKIERKYVENIEPREKPTPKKERYAGELKRLIEDLK